MSALRELAAAVSARIRETKRFIEEENCEASRLWVKAHAHENLIAIRVPVVLYPSCGLDALQVAAIGRINWLPRANY